MKLLALIFPGLKPRITFAPDAETRRDDSIECAMAMGAIEGERRVVNRFEKKVAQLRADRTTPPPKPAPVIYVPSPYVLKCMRQGLSLEVALMMESQCQAAERRYAQTFTKPRWGDDQDAANIATAL